jgi:hypothetical protein
MMLSGSRLWGPVVDRAKTLCRRIGAPINFGAFGCKQCWRRADRMTVDQNRIWDKVFEYRLECDFKSADSFLAADRSDLIDGEGLNRFLQSIEDGLCGLDPSKIHAAKNIVLELAGNTLLHGPKDGTSQELLLLIRRRHVVSVWMFGAGRKSQIERLKSIIDRIGDSAEVFNDRQRLLKGRNMDLLRRSSSPTSNQPGSGVGMRTIAALSSEPLWFKPKYSNDEASFALRSIV